MRDLVALGIRLHKPTSKDHPCAECAVVTENPDRLLKGDSVRPPRAYTDAQALAHLHEAIVRIVKENEAKVALVWTVENIARGNAIRPGIRAEGAVSAAAHLAGATVSLAQWQTIAANTRASRPKAEYQDATDVCGIKVGSVDPRAVLAALAALRS
jgi:hypothetical protein